MYLILSLIWSYDYFYFQTYSISSQEDQSTLAPQTETPAVSSIKIDPLANSPQENTTNSNNMDDAGQNDLSNTDTKSVTSNVAGKKRKASSKPHQKSTSISNGSKGSDNKLLNTSDLESMDDSEHNTASGNGTDAKSSDVKNTTSNGAADSENDFMSTLNLMPMDTPEENDFPGDEASNTEGASIKIEPKSEPDTALNNGSAAAWMSALATSVGHQKSVGTDIDFSYSIKNEHVGTNVRRKKEGKSGALSESAISKAIIQTPVKIKNSGDEDTIRFMTQYMCRYCAQRFDSVTKMQEHVQGHLRGRNNNHTCSVCGKEYRTPSKLQRHVRVHSGERPYACTVCGRRFTRSDHVKQHMKVHLPPQELNCCRLCGTRFLKRQSLQLHLQQAHLVNQLFTCHRCGEAYESLEQLNSHNLTHDAILNSMNSDGQAHSEVAPSTGLAKFALGPPVKQVNAPIVNLNKEPKEKKLPAVEKVSEAATTPGSTQQYNYVLTLNAPDQDEVTKISDKLIAESIEEESKKYEEIKRQIEEHAKLMAEETLKRQEEFENDRQKREEEDKIAAAFNIERDDKLEEKQDDSSMDVSEYENPAVLTSEDGMSMYISTDMLKLKEGADASDGSNSSINENEDSEMKDNDGKEHTEQISDGSEASKEITVIAGNNKSYRPGPRWFKTAQEIHRNAIANKQTDKILNIPKVDTASSEPSTGTQPKMISCIKPSINELLKAKVEQKNSNVSDKDQPIHTPVVGIPQIRPVPIAPRQVQQYILVSPPPQASTTQVTPPNQPKDGLLRCEHCCIWFEDRAMSMLHNTLHSADKADPFTCRKCYKKMGNRLEFTAHLVWHLEPNMDI